MTTLLTQLNDALRAGKIGPKDLGFAESLAMQGNRGKTWSPKQTYWADLLVKRANQPPLPTAALNPKITGLFGMLAGARANHRLKWPKIRLQAADGTPVVLGMTGPNSKYPGQVQITDGGPYGSNRYFGRIDQAGVLTAAPKMTPAVRALLDTFAADPVAGAKEYGRLTGNCCFCNARLDTPESTSAGYGPVCAKHYGLPWGAVVALPAAA